MLFFERHEDEYGNIQLSRTKAELVTNSDKSANHTHTSNNLLYNCNDEYLTTILIFQNIINNFQRHVVPFLEAKGFDVENKTEVLEKLLHEPMDAWSYNIRRPLVNSYYTFDNQNRKTLFDCTVVCKDYSHQTKQVLVTSVRGCKAEVTPDDTGNAISEFEYHKLIVLVGPEFTMLADALGSDSSFLVVHDIWPNETLPTAIQRSRPRRVANSENLNLKYILLSKPKGKPPERWFANTCDQCKGTGTYHTPPFSCGRCNGTGDYIGKFGDRMGDCRNCNGSGMITLPSKQCKGCNGSGYKPLQINFSSSPIFTWRVRTDDGDFQNEEVAIKKILIYDWNKKTKIANDGQLTDQLFTLIEESTGGSPPSIAIPKLQKLTSQWNLLNTCLNESEKAERSVLQEPLSIAHHRPSSHRKQGYVYYEFEIIGPKKDWSNKRALDWRPNTTLKISQKAMNKNRWEVQLKRQSDTSLNAQRDLTCVFEKLIPDKTKPRVLLRFDVALDAGSLPEKMLVEPRTSNPPEKQQRRHLERFLKRENWSHPILCGIALHDGTSNKLPEITISDPNLAKNDRQVCAVNLAVSGAPVTLIKGPPGTGKTTIITEIVRQTVAEDKKVLVCSQTHQAVRNVMERLEKFKYRMLRHVNEENAEDIDRKYSWRQIDKEVESIQKRINETVNIWISTIATIQAAQELSSKLERISEEEQALKTKLQNHLQALDKQQKTESNNFDNEHNKFVSELNQTRRKEEDSLQSSQKMLKTHESKFKNLNEALSKKNSKAKGDQKKTTSPISKMWIAIGIPQWANSATLQRKIHEEQVAIESLKKRVKETKAKIDKVTETKTTREKEKAKWLVVHSTNWNVARKSKEAEYRKSVIKFENQRKEVQERYRPISDRASEMVKDTVFLSPEERDPDKWCTFNANLREVLATTQQKLKLTRDWDEDLAAHAGEVSETLFDDVRIFFSTCVGLASWKKLHKYIPECIDLVIIDEAGKATLPETIIPALYARRIILIGDDKQLPPTLNMNIACRPKTCKSSRNHIDCWLETSLFEQLWQKKGDSLGVMLNTQHRMHHDIADFVSKMFYNGELLSGSKAPNGTIGFAEFNRPVCLVPTMAWKEDRYETFNESENAYSNQLEAKLVKKILLRAKETLDKKVEIGVITPYADQRELIRNFVKPLFSESGHINISPSDIDSVDSFQGGERDIIIISFTRSPKPCKKCRGNRKVKNNQTCPTCKGRGWQGSKFSFLLDLKRLNVAFSRAKCMLILVGDIEALTDERFSQQGHKGHEAIRHFYEYVQDRGRVMHVWEAGHEDKE